MEITRVPCPAVVFVDQVGKNDCMAIDLFSDHAEQYKQFRPTYPASLYQFIYSQVETFDRVWDCGTGNGQAARVLASSFKKVLATDISVEQINNAYKTENILYSVGGEQTSFADQSIDLITVAQALHWFDLEKFYQEVKRVAKPKGVLAVWGYSLLNINEAIDPVLLDFYKNTVGPFWNAERKLIDEEYKTIPFPFEEIKTPEFNFSFEWTIDHLEGYLTSWSAVQKYLKANKISPVPTLMAEIKPHWVQDSMTVTFPLFLRLGRL